MKVREIVKSSKVFLLRIFILGLFTFVSVDNYCQIKINDFSAIEGEVKKGSDSAKTIALSIIAGVLAIALIFVVWEIASGKPNGKDHLIGWLIAVGVVIIAGFII